MLSTQRVEYVSKVARSLWEDFLETNEDKYNAESLFESTRSMKEVNPAIRDFFRYCAELMAPSEAEDSDESNVLMMDLTPITQPKTGKAASWLTRHTSTSKYCVSIAIDLSCLQQNLDFNNAFRVRNHLTLHEIGHLTLHPELLPDGVEQSEATYAKSAAPAHEAEAWWFCYSLLGLAVADVAYANKQNPDNADDQIWKMTLR
jgi:hypothetical protein